MRPFCPFTPFRFAAPFVLVVLAAAGCDNQSTPAAQRSGPGPISLTAAFDADFSLVDHYGETATDERFAGQPMLIYFGFTTCPDVCPAALGTMTATLDQLGEKAGAIQPLFITVDPERDTPDRLSDHLAYDGRILGLTGDADALAEARAALKHYAARREMPDSALGYTMDHQRLFYLTDREGTPVLALPDTMAPEAIASIVSDQLRS